MEGMPYYMKVKIAKHLCRDILKAVNILEGCSEYFMDAVAVHLKEVFYVHNQVSRALRSQCHVCPLSTEIGKHAQETTDDTFLLYIWHHQIPLTLWGNALQVIFQQEDIPKEMYILQFGVVIITTVLPNDDADEHETAASRGNKDPSNILTDKVSNAKHPAFLLCVYFEICVALLEIQDLLGV